MRLTLPTTAAAHYRIAIMGGGAGGIAMCHRFKRLVPKGQLAVIEPSEDHYYQPGFTLVGSGMKSVESCLRKTRDLIHPNAVWVKQAVAEMNPRSNSLTLADGSEIKYDFLVVATGLQLRFDMIEGLMEALRHDGVCSIYGADVSQKTHRELRSFKGGQAIFTFPNTPIKCAGAPQKILYVADDIFRQRGVRDQTKLMYNTSLGAVFGVKKYAEVLNKVVEEKNIQLNVRTNLCRVDPIKRTATFELLDDNAKPTGKHVDYQYDLLHVAPPCTTVKALRECKELTDAKGWLDVNPKTLLSTKFDNVLGIGDCMNSANAKTAAAISSQMRTMNTNLPALIRGEKLTAEYDGYASCPLLVSQRRVVLAEFNPDGPLETLPLDGAKPRYLYYLFKRYFFPFLYWNFLIKGYWLGPAKFRKMFHLGF